METHLTTSAFDGVADRYDVEFTDTAVGRALRSMVWSRLAVSSGLLSGSWNWAAERERTLSVLPWQV